VGNKDRTILFALAGKSQIHRDVYLVGQFDRQQDRDELVFWKELQTDQDEWNGGRYNWECENTGRRAIGLYW